MRIHNSLIRNHLSGVTRRAPIPLNTALYARPSTVSAYKLHRNCIELSSRKAAQPDAACAGAASELRGSSWLRCCYGPIVKSMLSSYCQSRGGKGFAGGRSSPNLVPHTTSALLLPMDPIFTRRRGLVIAPGLLHVGGHGQASPSPQTNRNPARVRAVRHREVSGRREHGVRGELGAANRRLITGSYRV